jgi:hypothetical protein
MIRPMHVLYFLKERTRFIRKFYDVAENTFAETKRMIRDGESPLDEYPPGYNPEDGEPPFMDEYHDADDAQEFLGQSGVSFLSASLKLFFDEMRFELRRFYRRHNPRLSSGTRRRVRVGPRRQGAGREYRHREEREQAYSYAIHREIRAPFYGLCNGRKLVVFHVAQAGPVIDVPLQEIAGIWPMVLGILGCRSAWPAGVPPGFNPDMGLALAKAGLAEDADGKKYYHVFTSVPVRYVGKVEDGLYCITALYESPLRDQEG